MKFGKQMYDEVARFPPEYMPALVFYKAMKKVVKREVAAQGGNVRSLIENRPTPNNDHGDDAELCLVCHEPAMGDEAVETSCKHVFHKVCLRAWVGTGNASCPTCRADLQELMDADFEAHQSVYGMCDDVCSGKGRFWKSLFAYEEHSERLFRSKMKLRLSKLGALCDAAKSSFLSYLREKPKLTSRIVRNFRRIALLKKIKEEYVETIVLTHFCELEVLSRVKIFKKRDKLLGNFSKPFLEKINQASSRSYACSLNGPLQLLMFFYRSLYNALHQISDTAHFPDGFLGEFLSARVADIQVWQEGILECWTPTRTCFGSFTAEETEAWGQRWRAARKATSHEIRYVRNHLERPCVLLEKAQKKTLSKVGQRMLRNHYLKDTRSGDSHLVLARH